MARPATLYSLLDVIRKSGLIDGAKLVARVEASPLPEDPDEALAVLVREGLITPFQARHLRDGKSRGFLLGPYRILSSLGRGGMGVVYLAQHTSMNRLVAIKVLRTDLHRTAGARERFAREGRATAALNHPNIVRIYDVLEDQGQHFLVMEYVQGKPLSVMLREKGRFPVARAVHVIRQAAAGLHHAHERGIIHRDLKPDNLLMTGDGAVKLLDMGLARFFEDSTDNLTERVGGGFLGSPDFIAPEQAAHRADPRSDIYALGATLYCLLLGTPPFTGPTAAAKIVAHQTQPVPPPHVRDPSIPPEVSAVVLKMLAKSPADRFQTAAEVLAALSVVSEPRHPEEAIGPAHPAQPGRRRLWMVLGAAVAALALGGALTWWFAGLIH